MFSTLILQLDGAELKPISIFSQKTEATSTYYAKLNAILSAFACVLCLVIFQIICEVRH